MAVKVQRQARQWHISPTSLSSSASLRERFPSMHPVVAQILYNRGFTSAESAQSFLSGERAGGDPFSLHGMGKAVARIRSAIGKGELIIVYGDFDADGVTSTALLLSVLQALGARVHPYIPDRVDEGYGLHDAALIKLAHKGAKVVITVDCGIRSVHEVEVGTQAGLTMIVTDHHSLGPEVPNAYAVINPKQTNCKYPEKMLAGVGVTFKLAEGLLRAAIQDRRPISMVPGDLLDLVAIGTVADLVPMNHAENRALVIRGLEKLREAQRPGLRALLAVAGVAPETVDAQSIGFALAPRINAAGRLSSAATALELLCTDNYEMAMTRAQELQELNVRRQELTREAQNFARKLSGLEDGRDPGGVPLIFAIDANFKQGIVGLVAGRLAEEYYRPAIVMHRGDTESHGSCRSITEFNITEALDQCADLLIRHGGHAQAAGFAIENANLPAFRERIMDIAAAGLRDQDLRPHLEIDAELPLSHLDMALHEGLSALQPCGHDFPHPILCTRKLRVTDARTVGAENAHLKLTLSDGTQQMDAIGFRMGELLRNLPNVVDAAYELDVNEWNGSRRLQLVLQDVREGGRD